jgi:hypothetical protein
VLLLAATGSVLLLVAARRRWAPAPTTDAAAPTEPAPRDRVGVSA